MDNDLKTNIKRDFKIALTIVTIILGYVFCSEARAQTTQPVYVRPSNGAALDVKTLLTRSNGTVSATWHDGAAGGTNYVLTSPVFDFSTFPMAIITIKSQNTCPTAPVIQIFGGATAGGINFDFPISAPNAAFIYQSTDAIYYLVSPISSFIKVRVSASDVSRGGAGANTCTISTFTVTPVPFIAPKVISGSGMRALDSGSGVIPALLVTPTQLIGSNVSNALFSKQTIIIQNQSVSPVYCSLFDDVSNTNFAFSLAAGSAKANGTGGSRELRDWAAPVFCLVAAAAACLPNDCLVSAFAY